MNGTMIAVRTALLTLLCTHAYCAAAESGDDQGKRILLIHDIDQTTIAQQIEGANGGTMYQFGAIGGIVGALVADSIEHRRVEKTKSLIELLQEGLEGIDVNQVIRDEYRSALNELGYSITREVDAPEKLKARKMFTDLAHADESSALLVTTQYHMTPKLETMELVATYSLYQRGATRPLRKNEVIYQSPVSVHDRLLTVEQQRAAREKVEVDFQAEMKRADGKVARNMARKNRMNRLASLEKAYIVDAPGTTTWFSDDARMLRDELAKGAKQVARLVALDLDGRIVVPRGTRKTKIRQVDPDAFSESRRVYRIEELSSDDVDVVRLRDGTIVAKDPDSPLFAGGGQRAQVPES